MAIPAELAWTAPIVFGHVAGGGVALVCGAVAMAAPKGGRFHVLAGQGFVAGTAVMAVFGIALALIGPMTLGAVGGGLVFYLAGSGWAAARRKTAAADWVVWSGFIAGLIFIAALATLGLIAKGRPNGEFGEQAAVRYFIMAGITALPVLMDLTLILRGGIGGAQRIMRHLWRMSLALFIAASTFFLGQPDIFVGVSTRLLAIPSLTILALMLFWLARAPFKYGARKAG